MQLTNQGQEKKTTDKGQVIRSYPYCSFQMCSHNDTIVYFFVVKSIHLQSIYFHNTTSIAIADQTHTLIFNT